jgi:hypothetical protein
MGIPYYSAVGNLEFPFYKYEVVLRSNQPPSALGVNVDLQRTEAARQIHRSPQPAEVPFQSAFFSERSRK